MQQVNFPIELIIGEDCSTDGTRKIVMEYARKYPDIIRPLLPDSNLGMMKNFIETMQAATGKYIALCEGDDYWTDPYKLQKQVDFLEANPEYSFCFHDNIILNQKTGEKRIRTGERQIDRSVDLKSIILEKNMATATLVFRNIIDWSNIPEWFSQIGQGDYGLVVLLAEKGFGQFLPDVMSVYRIHDGGVWSGNKQRSYHINEDIKFYNFLYDYFSQPHIRKAIKLKRSKSYQNLGINQIRDGQFFTGLLQVVTNWNFTNDKRFKTPLRKIASAVKTGLKFHLSNTNRNGL
jgi:glycosyltransferase involved in cell wall biosynthesis